MAYMVIPAGQNGPYAPITVRTVNLGDGYGRAMALTHTEDEPMVEFYDARYAFTPYGQFVCRYDLSTLLKRSSVVDMHLFGDAFDWAVTSSAMRTITGFLSGLYPELVPDQRTDVSLPGMGS